MGYNEEYLAHSKGPWKKHKYTGVIQTSSGKKRYVYPGKGSGERVTATRLSANGQRTHYTKNYQINDDGSVSKRKKNTGYSVKTKAKRKVQTTVRDVKYNGGKAASKAKAAVGRAANTAGHKVERAKRMAKVYKNIATWNIKDAAKKGGAAINNLMTKARHTANRAKRMTKVYADKAHFARLDAQSAAKKKYTKVKTTAERKAALARGRRKDRRTKRNMNKIRKNVAKARQKNYYSKFKNPKK